MMQHPSRPAVSDLIVPKLNLVAWELTRRCNLLCAHCRASAADMQYSGELSLDECRRVIDEIAVVANPILILTGGEPLMRQNFFDIASYAAKKGLRVVLGTNGTLLTPEIARKLKEVPIARIGISLDFPTAALQDKFRGQSGAFDAAIKGIAAAREAGVEVQINSTVSRLNVDKLEDLLGLALDIGAVAFHPFMLVPTGRGKGLCAEELPPERYESVLNWIYDKQQTLGGRIFFKPTDAPHYVRILKQRAHEGPPPGFHPASSGHPGGHPGNTISRGCLAGTGFAFISYQGKVKGCGYLDVEAGDLRKESFAKVWADSPVFNQLRDLSLLKGKCGACEFKRVCGGCRARSFEATGDYLEAEPYCVYQPRMIKNA